MRTAVLPSVPEAPPGDLPARTKRWVYFAILVVVALGARLYMLDELPYGLNADETRMAFDGYLYLEEGVYRPLVFQYRESTQPYVYGGLIKFYGFSNGVMRSPSALVGVVSSLCLCLLIFKVLPDFWAFCCRRVSTPMPPKVTTFLQDLTVLVTGHWLLATGYWLHANPRCPGAPSHLGGTHRSIASTQYPVPGIEH
jgi:hypothetical protein